MDSCNVSLQSQDETRSDRQAPEDNNRSKEEKEEDREAYKVAVIRQYLRDGTYPRHLSTNERRAIRKAVGQGQYELVGKALCYNTHIIKGVKDPKNKCLLVVSEQEEKKRLFRQCHIPDGVTHNALNPTVHRLSTTHYWKGMKAYAQQMIEACDLCQREKEKRQKAIAPHRRLSMQTKEPWNMINTLAAAAAAAAGDMGDTKQAGEGDGEKAQPSTAGTPDAPYVRPKKSRKKSKAGEDGVQNGVTEKGEQSQESQQKTPENPKALVHVTERAAYADWTKSVMEELEPSLWRGFQAEHSQMLYRYLGMSDDIKSAAVAQHTGVSQQQQRLPPSHQFQASFQHRHPPPLQFQPPSQQLQQPQPQQFYLNISEFS